MQTLFCSFGIILECWDITAEKRPNFAELVNRLTSDLVVMADYMDFNPTQETSEIHVNATIEDIQDID